MWHRDTGELWRHEGNLFYYPPINIPGYDVLPPVHLSEYPEGLEDNYSFTDGHCDWSGGGEIQPCGYEDVNNWRGSLPSRYHSNMMYSTWT